ncbi:glycosyltransferase family 2 protein [Candidatus Wolfebacteria bacterium]|nr:glycosyltransferase family 2 protein [Candidatus Wolfebacteria bacterium]
MPPETSIVIRTKNCKKWIEIILRKLFEQTYKNFEVVIVDSGSTDDSLSIIRKFPVKIFKIPPKDFSYPYALNYGIKRASAKKYIVIISDHSIPISNTWLNDGINNFKKYEKIMGVYGPQRALPDSSIWDKFYFDARWFLKRIKRGRECESFVVNKDDTGVMGFTNAIIPKKLWVEKNFDEKYGMGGEEGPWVRYWLNMGYIAIKDEKFIVYHSHNLSFWGWIKQYKYCQSLSTPQPFDVQKLSFRKDFEKYK